MVKVETKFSKILQNEAVAEWRIKYIDYRSLKKKLRLVEKARIHNEKESKHSLPTNNAKLTYRRSQESQESQGVNSHSYIHEFTQPLSPPPDTSKRTSYQSQTQKQQRRFSLNSMADSANAFLHQVSWKLNNASNKQNTLENISMPKQITSLDTMMDQINVEERDFFEALKKELEKIEEFYETQETEAIKRFTILQQQFDDLKALENDKRTTRRSEIWSKTASMLSASLNRSSLLDERQVIDHKVAKKKIRKAVFEFYRGVKLLNTYRAVNKIGFVRILKKYDKVSNRNGYEIYMPRVKSSNFMKSDMLQLLIKDIEKFYIKNFEGGSRQRAMKKLRLPENKHNTFNATSLRVGLYFGASIPIMIILRGFVLNTDINFALKEWYIGILLPIVMSLLIGTNMYIWSQKRINYKFIFEFDPRNNLDFQQYLEIPSIMFLITNIIILLNYRNYNYDNTYYYPLFLLVIFIILLFCPYPILYYNARRWLLFTMGRQIACFYYRVEFRDFIIADIFTSLSYSFTTIRFLQCEFGDECYNSVSIMIPLLGMIPATIRMTHCLRRLYDTKKCFPHLANALKYSSLIITSWALFWRHNQNDENNVLSFWIWMASQIISTICAFSWDVLMDWSLFDLHSQNYLLRDHLVYGRNWIYYVAILVNFLLRSSWVLICPHGYQNVSTRTVMIIIATGELVRRWIWTLLRIENEHVNNCGNFRAIKDVPLPFVIEPIQIKIDEEIVTRTDSDSFNNNKVIVDEKVNNESTNWFLNLIKSTQTLKNNKKDEWRDFETSRRDIKDSDDFDEDDDEEEDYFVECMEENSNSDQDLKQSLSERIVLTKLDNSYKTYASRRLPIYSFN